MKYYKNYTLKNYQKNKYMIIIVNIFNVIYIGNNME